MEKAVDVASPRTVSGHAGPPPGQGPFLSLTLTLLGNRIQSASYETYQCPGCHACGKAIVGLATGRTLEEAGAVTYDVLVALVGPLPRHRQVCYSLAVLALSKALEGKLGPDDMRKESAE